MKHNNRRGSDRRQAKNNAVPWAGPERRKGTDRRRGGAEMILTALEPRVLFSGATDYLQPDIDMPAAFDVAATQETLRAQAGAAAGPTVPVSGAVPILHSRPSAAAKLVIDFDGDGAYQWGSYSVPATPAYDQDGDPSTFNTAELASINEIFLRVSEKYSPFNIDVTTEDPGVYNNKAAVKVIVGGNGAWLGSVAGGIAYIGGFYNLTDNKAYVFPANLANGYAKYTAEAIAHEAGHTFGLQHQGQYSGTTLVQEYNPGNSQVAPIMGNSYYAARGLWWYGTPSNNASATQDDLAKISALTNAFGYRADDYGNAADAATGLTLSGGAFSAAGVVEQYTDADYFSFSTSGAATLTLNLSVAQYGAMLDGSLFVYNASGTLLGSADTSSLGESLTLSLGGAGTYYVSVASHGGYGDMGQYTLTGSVAATQDPQMPVVVADPSGLTVTPASAGEIVLGWADNSDNEDGFIIQRSTDNGVTWTTLTTTGAGATSYHDKTVSGGRTYYYRVQAYNSSTSSSYTAGVSGTTVPSAPGTPVATANSSTQIAVTWADVTGETGYSIERSTDGGSTWTQVGTTGAGVTSFLDTGLTAGATYYYRVRAQDGTGWSGYSPAGGTVTVPAAPGAISATANSASQVTVTWSDVAGETGYVVERSLDGTSGWTQVGTTGAGVTTFADTGRAGGTRYYYRVRASNGSGSSAYTSVANALTVPAAPGTPVVTANSTTQVTVTWADVAGETGFAVERSADGGSTWTQVGTTTADLTTFVDTGLAAGAMYYYRVRAQDVTGWSGYSAEGGAATLPAAPGTPAAMANSSAQVTVTWADVVGETGYVVERSLDGTSGWTQAGSTAAGVTTFADTGRAGGTRYYYRVRAVNGSGSSAYSSVVNALTAPGTPTGVTATPVSTTQATVTWTAVTGATSYVIERSTDNVNWSTLTTTGTTTVNDMTLSAGTTYYYRVRASNASGTSGNSSVANVTTVPAAPGTISAVANSASQVTVTWADVAGEVSYAVERSADGGSTWAQVGTTGANVTTYVDTGLSAGATYLYRVRAQNVTGWSAYSASGGAVTLPAAPGTISAVANSSAQVTVTWSDVAGETGYVVERSADGTSGWAQVGSTSADVTTFVDTGRSGGTRYYYRVHAANGSGSSGDSPMAVVLTLPNAPAAMTEVTATANSASKITVEWQVVTGAGSYDVERSADGSTGWTRVATGVTETSYLDDGLTAETSYYYRVRAVNVSGASAFSGAVEATTQELPVSVVDPTLLTATPAGETRVDVAWQDNSNNEDGFVLERSDDGGATWVTVVTTDPGVTAYADTGLAGGTTYVYRVRAFSGAVTSDYAQAATATTVPAAPATPTVSTVSARAIRVTWAGVAGATGYVVEASAGGTGAWAAVGTVGGDVTEYVSNGLSAGTAYTFRVRAVGVSGASDASGAATAVTRPGAPGGVTVRGYTAGQLYVSWAAVAGADGYVVERSADGGASWERVGTTVGAGQTALNDTTVGAGTTYSYRVHAVNAGGVSEESVPAAAVSQASAPGNAAAAAVSASQVRVTWGAAAGAAGYVVERSADGVSWSLVGSVVGTTSYDDGGLSPNTAYSYRVRSVNEAGTSEAGDVVAATTQQAAPVAPGGLSVVPVSTEMVQLSWEDRSGNESGFKVEYSTNGGRTWELAGSVRADTSVVRVTGLEQGQKYTFRVSAYNEMGFSGTTNKAAGRALSAKAMRTKALRKKLHKALRRALSAADATPAPAPAPAPAPVVLDIRKVKAVFKGLPKALAPEAATELVATPYSTSAAQLTWTDNADSELGYRVEYSVNGRVWLLAGYVKADQTGCRVTGLEAGEKYKFRVSAYNLAGTTRHSATTRAVMPRHKPKWSVAHPSSEPDQDTVLNVNRVRDVAPGLPANLRAA